MRPVPIVACALTVAIAAAFELSFPHAATADTHLGTVTITTDTTWSPTNDPYVLDGNVTVSSGATLTIDAGTVIKFNGLRTLSVNGTLRAMGTPGGAVTFTSLQDDSIRGDTGGDGYTAGAPGQWYNIALNGSSDLTELHYVVIRYGGWGSANPGYGALSIGGSGAPSIDHATITNNQRSGIKVTGSGGAAITKSTIAENANGISINQSSATIVTSEIRDNSSDGVWINLTDSFAGNQTYLIDNDITSNGGNGVTVGAIHATFPSSLFPRGFNNNIFDNSGKQFYSVYYHAGADWSGNYWGSDVSYRANPSVCLGTSPNSPGHLQYNWDAATPPPYGPTGPISWASYLVNTPNGSVFCLYDRVRVNQDQFAQSYIGHSGGGAGSGGFNTAWYSFSNSACTTKADPITTVFYGTEGDVSSALAHISDHTGWTEPILSGDQYFQSYDLCFPAQGERASGSTTRYHVRARQTGQADPDLGLTTVATPHHEDLSLCDPLVNHAVDENGPNGSGFDQGRETLWNAFLGQHYLYEEYKGNTRSILQCDGGYAGSNGYVLFIEIP